MSIANTYGVFLHRLNVCACKWHSKMTHYTLENHRNVSEEVCDLQNSYNLTVGLMFHSADIFRTSSPGDSILSNPAPEMGAKRAARLWRRFATKGDATRHPALRKVALLHVWEDAGVWAHRGHPFGVHLRPAPEAVSCAFCIPSSPGSLEGEAAVWGCGRRHSPPSRVPTSSQRRATVAAAWGILVYWHGRKCPISQLERSYCLKTSISLLGSLY